MKKAVREPTEYIRSLAYTRLSGLHGIGLLVHHSRTTVAVFRAYSRAITDMYPVHLTSNY